MQSSSFLATSTNVTKVIGGKKKLVGITLGKVGGANSLLKIFKDSGGTILVYEFDGTVGHSDIGLEIPFVNGIYAQVVTGGEYNILYA